MGNGSRPRFICDAMLGHIGRRLRSAGYDTLIDAGKIPDSALVALAQLEGRILLTCDKDIRETKDAVVIYCSSNNERDWATKLVLEASVDWTFAPMTRCLDCNTRLAPADDGHLARMPEGIRKYNPAGLVCTTCDKVFWEGSHTRRMRARLEDLQSTAQGCV